jgi:hypothetical protein
MRRALLTALLLVAGASAQTVPVLHKRSAQPSTEPQAEAAAGYSALPADASGEYELDDKGSVVQITIQDNRLTGYVTKMQGDAALSLFFDKTSIEGSRVSFTTRTVHGLHYSFQGEIVRGDSVSPDQNGFYRMVGELTEYRNDLKERKLVHLKSTPRTP